MRILLSSVGRRGYLVKYFKQALAGTGEVWGADSSSYAPAFAFCDRSVILPKVIQEDYSDKLLTLCMINKIDMVVPLIDPELEVLSRRCDDFHSKGIMVVVSPIKTIEIAFDKYLTYQHAKKAGIGVPQTITSIEEAFDLLSEGELSWPLMVKPRKGSASLFVNSCSNRSELTLAFQSCPAPIIQQFVSGEEYGYDLFCDRDFSPVNIYCKRKIAMRAGETDKAVSVNDKKFMDLGIKIAQAFPMFGPADVDIKMDKNGPMLLEINPRFGGGYPCAHLCGADFPTKLITICKGQKLTPDFGNYPAGVYMLKQDEILSPSAEDFKKIINTHDPKIV